MRALASIPFLVAVVLPQARPTPRTIYQREAKSVLVLYVRLGAEFVAQGTGFVVGAGQIVTNAHVADAGTVYVQLGPAKIPAKLVREDGIDDLALLSVDGDLGVPALALATALPSAGDSILVIGNPEGLAQTISAGIVAAARVQDGKPVLQITAPVSHGSSGSPVLNSAGLVIGVVSAAMADGQNLNFAAPVTVLRALLAGSHSPMNFSAAIAAAELLQARLAQTDYSDSPESPYQLLAARTERAFQQASDRAQGDADALHRIYRDWPSLAVARAEVAARPDSVSYLDLAYSLESSSLGSNAPAHALPDALAAANASIAALPNPEADPYVEKGEILNESALYAQADAAFNSALTADPGLSGDLLRRAYAGLAGADFGLGRFAESNAWFGKIVQAGLANCWLWSAQADRLESQRDYANAAQDYRTAAVDPNDFVPYQDGENAARNFLLSSQPDPELAAARQCVAAAPDDAQGKAAAENCHFWIASVLNSRGVFSSALPEAQAAVALDPKDAWAFDAEAAALSGLRRLPEAISAEQSAISLSDGKYSTMQFDLGNIYFDQQDWQNSGDAFERAAHMDTTDFAAAYNAALCDERREDYADALQWLQEAQRRNPPSDEVDKISRDIARLQRILGG